MNVHVDEPGPDHTTRTLDALFVCRRRIRARSDINDAIGLDDKRAAGHKLSGLDDRGARKERSFHQPPTGFGTISIFLPSSGSAGAPETRKTSRSTSFRSRISACSSGAVQMITPGPLPG